jgi:hypothetical protein
VHLALQEHSPLGALPLAAPVFAQADQNVLEPLAAPLPAQSVFRVLESNESVSLLARSASPLAQWVSLPLALQVLVPQQEPS